jgi:DNA-binding GntR family transcriptional regulator
MNYNRHFCGCQPVYGKVQFLKKPRAMKKAANQINNAVERAYAYLLNKTISFGFHPGERINEVELAATLEMSRAPVREALNRLVMQGLVVSESGKGFFCRKLSTKEVSELLEVRSELELSAIRHACLKASDQAIQEAVLRWQAMEFDPATMDLEALVDIDEAFHLGVAALANNAERLNFLRNINARIRFVRRISLENEARDETFILEHSRILEAITHRDAEKAMALMESHIRSNSEELTANIHEGLARIYADEVI